MRMRSIVALGLALLASAAGAATVAPPRDLGALARMSAAVVEARAGASRVEAAGDAFYTVTPFTRLRALGAAATGAEFTVREMGGGDGVRGLAVGGAPVFQAGRTYLLFLDRAEGPHWRTRTMAYGLLVQDEESGLLVPVPEAGAIDVLDGARFEPVVAYRPDLLLAHLEEVLGGAAWSRERAGATDVPRAATATPPTQCKFLLYSGDNRPVRWFNYEPGTNFSAVKATTPGQAGIADGGTGAVSQGAAAWTNHADSIIHYAVAAPTPAVVNCTNGQEQNAVWFNDPCAAIPDLSGCAGTLAFGGAFFSTATTLYDGDPWHAASSTFVIVNNGAGCIGEVSFREMMTHELGHTQGFGHHDPTPAPNPTMSAVIKGDGRGATLVGADKFCASFAYHTFLDVPYAHFAWRFVEAVENAGVTSGCNAGNYCPDLGVTRDQMAVFLLLSREGPTYSPPACTTPPFSDVPVSSPYCKWIKELVNRHITAGCGSGLYCPTAPVTREQMAVFLLLTKEGSAYVPPACTTQTFGDVPCTSAYARWIYELVRRGIASGCGGGNYCPTQPNTRAQMAVFLATTFALPLPN